MSDNVSITAGSGTTIATDDIGSGVQVQRVKPVWGADGTGTDAQVAQPLPVQATIESSQMSNVGTIVTPKFASISDSASGQTAIVAADATRKIRVTAYVLVADAAVTAKFQNGSTDVTGPMSLAANGGVVAPFNPAGWFETAANTALNLNLGAAVGVRGHLTYLLI